MSIDYPRIVLVIQLVDRQILLRMYPMIFIISIGSASYRKISLIRTGDRQLILCLCLIKINIARVALLLCFRKFTYNIQSGLDFIIWSNSVVCIIFQILNGGIKIILISFGNYLGNRLHTANFNVVFTYNVISKRPLSPLL